QRPVPHHLHDEQRTGDLPHPLGSAHARQRPAPARGGRAHRRVRPGPRGGTTLSPRLPSRRRRGRCPSRPGARCSRPAPARILVPVIRSWPPSRQESSLSSTFATRWESFSLRHPELSKFAMFFIFSNGVTLLQLALMPIFRAGLNAFTSLAAVDFQVLPVGSDVDGSQYYMFDY